MDFAIQVRLAQPNEAPLLSDLIFRSKAHWGYAAALMDLWRSQLQIAPETIVHNPVAVAEDTQTHRLLGVAHLCPPTSEGEALLEDLFVDPDAMGRGVGSLLWRWAVAEARSMGARALVLDADPHAQGFYERMGAVVVGARATPEVPGRSLPRMRYELPLADATQS